MRYITALMIYAASLILFFGNVFIMYEFFLTCKRTLIGADTMSVYIWMLMAVPFLLLLGWQGAKRQHGAFRINYSGTSFYGNTPTKIGYVTTMWVTVLGFPLIPVRSFQVYAEKDLPPDAKQYDMKAINSLYWPQIKKTLRKGLIILILIEVAVTVAFNVLCLSVPGPRF